MDSVYQLGNFGRKFLILDLINSIKVGEAEHKIAQDLFNFCLEEKQVFSSTSLLLLDLTLKCIYLYSSLFCDKM